MTLNLTSNIAAGLTIIAAARGLSVDEMPAEEGSGMMLENGLLIYGAGTAMPDSIIDDAIRRSREERSQHLLGTLS